MIRLSTLGFVLLAGALCLAVFSIKHQVIALENRWNEINREIARDQQAIHVLRAEWSYLNDPQRLRRLAETHLEMSPMIGRQIVGFADLPMQPVQLEIAPDNESRLLPVPDALAARPPELAPGARTSTHITQVSSPTPRGPR